MSLYAIKDGDGVLRDRMGDSPDSTREFYAYTDISVDSAKAKADEDCYSHVVELVEKAEPVEVSKKAGKTLADLREELAHGNPANSSDYYVDTLKLQHDMSIEDIFRALDVGWTVKQPQRWYVKVPEEWDSVSGRQRFYKRNDNSIGQAIERFADNTADEQFTAEEIEKYHLDGFETVEVED
jgi:hypothetical protein